MRRLTIASIGAACSCIHQAGATLGSVFAASLVVPIVTHMHKELSAEEDPAEAAAALELQQQPPAAAKQGRKAKRRG